MTYIEYLNQFHRWRENGNPGDKLIVLYLNMLDMFNQRYWPEWAGVTTQQLMVLANTASKNTALSARDALVKAGFLEYRKGRKGKATAYRLLSFGIKSDTENRTESDTKNGTENDGAGGGGKDTETQNGGVQMENGITFDTENSAEKNGIKSDTENRTENRTENDTKNRTENGTPNKIKTKTQTKNGSERGGADAAASPAIVRHKYGKYKHILLSDEEVRKLGEKLGQEETNRCVRYLDEYVEIHGNKCHWRNFYLVALKCSREKWGIRDDGASANGNGGTDWAALAREMDEEDARRSTL